MTLTTQFITIITMSLMGIEFAAAYDTYMRIFRRLLENKWILRTCDVIFMLVQAVVMFFVLYKVNNGELRIYIVLSLVCGYAIYKSLLSRLYNWVLEKVIIIFLSITKAILKVIDVLLITPFRLIINLIIHILKIMKKILLKCSNLLLMVAKYGVKALLSIIHILFIPLRGIVKIIPIKYRIKIVARMEKLLTKFTNKLKKK